MACGKAFSAFQRSCRFAVDRCSTCLKTYFRRRLRQIHAKGHVPINILGPYFFLSFHCYPEAFEYMGPGGGPEAQSSTLHTIQSAGT